MSCPGDSWVACNTWLISPGFCVLYHTAELQDVEGLTSLGDTLLLLEYRTSILQLNSQSYNEHKW